MTTFLTPDQAELLDATAERIAAHLTRTGHDPDARVNFDDWQDFNTWAIDHSMAHLLSGHGVLITSQAFLLLTEGEHDMARRRYLANAITATLAVHSATVESCYALGDTTR